MLTAIGMIVAITVFGGIAAVGINTLVDVILKDKDN